MQKVKLLILLIILTATFLSLIFVFKAIGKEENGICLEKSYQVYKSNFMSNDGRIIDYERGGITTSEGQAYMMLRSLACNDRKTFDLVYKWTKEHLQRQDRLFSWIWGKDNSQYKILDLNSASDADIDIAFALISAYEQYKDNFYLQESLPIIHSIWDNEVKKEGNYLVLMPGVQQTSETPVQINPSYFSPYMFKTFQIYDDMHDWFILVDSSYNLLFKISASEQTGLFPDWCILEDNKIIIENFKRGSFSYDAIRVFPRVYLDYLYTKDKRALAILKKSEFFVDKWQKSKDYLTFYNPDGSLSKDYEFAGAIALLLPAISSYNPKFADFVYKNKIFMTLNENYWKGKTDYYGKNLSWFGVYLYQKGVGKKVKCKKNVRTN